MLTAKAIEEFMVSRGGCRPATQREYRKNLIFFSRSFNHLPEDPQAIQVWLNGQVRQRDGKALAPETVHVRYRTLRTFYKQIHRYHPRVPDPMPLVEPPTLHRKVRRTFADGELQRLFSLRLSPRDRAMITLFLDVGARAQEVANLTWEDLVPGYATLHGKTGERVVPISESTYRLLTALKPEVPPAPASRQVFLSKRRSLPLTYDGIYYIVRTLCEEAGIVGRRSSPHSFRHTFGTNYAAADGCDPSVLQDIMGHKDFKTTLIYIHNNAKRMAANHQRCTPLKGLAAAAQGTLFSDELVREEGTLFSNELLREAEAILARRRDKDQAVEEPAGNQTVSSRGTG